MAKKGVTQVNEEPKNQIKELSRIQRRVLGVLMEKAFTTPEQYPLTLKATTTACNQKSNRSPQVSYDEGQVQDALDQMREDLLVAEVFPGGGRTARYRHYMRNKFDFSEPQLGIIAELLLRGRQQPGELRTRASRMVRIDSQDQLRQELMDLQQKGYLQANGPLERRGVEVDHTFYLPKERMDIGNVAAATVDDAPAAESNTAPAAPRSTVAPAVSPAVSDELLNAVEQLTTTVKEQAETIRGMESMLADVEDRIQKLERDLGL